MPSKALFDGLPMPLSTLLSTWRADPDMASNIAAWRTIPARPAQFKPFPDDLHPALMDALRARGICALYTHQAAAWQHTQAGQHSVVVTGTASGKTLCYNLPVLNRLLRGRMYARCTSFRPKPWRRIGRIRCASFSWRWRISWLSATHHQRSLFPRTTATRRPRRAPPFVPRRAW